MEENELKNIPNGQALLAFLEQAVGGPYLYGGTGQRCSPEYRAEKIRQYSRHADRIRAACPVLSGRVDACRLCRWHGRPAYDCAQFVRSALRIAGVSLPSGATSQWNADVWERRGRIGDGPLPALCALFRLRDGRMQHVGLCLGERRVYDARGHETGVIKSDFLAYPWTHYAVPRLAGGLPLQKAQELLIRAGYALPRYGADGKMGGETEAALLRFQKERGLVPSGVLDLPTAEALMSGASPLQEQLAVLTGRIERLEERCRRC